MSRKRRRDRPRTKSGQLSRAYLTIARDYGTPEVQAKRLALVGENADPALSASAPGILFAREMLDQEQYGKALVYRTLRAALFGPPWPANGSSGNETQELRLLSAKRALVALERRITKYQRQIVANVAVFDVLPPRRQIPDLTRALDAMLERAA